MQLATILWLGLLAGAAVLFVLTIRRMSRLIARTRGLERYQRGVDSIDRRFAAVIRPMVRALDETRRHTGDPEALARQVGDAAAVVTALSGEARALVAPPSLGGPHAALTAELDRAMRATGMIEHGLASIGAASIGRDLEAQTALKRGTLNLRHAQEAFSLRAREVAAVRPADLAAIPAASHPPAPPQTTYVVDGLDDVDGPFEPRM